jgi:serine/threonine-protein kinase HipA
MIKQLQVYLFDHSVGTLTQDRGKLSFIYNEQWLNSASPQALSGSLPLQADAFDDTECRPFFAGLLPEGELRRLLARQFQLSDGNSFGLLNEIGGECAGAVTFLEPGQTAREEAANTVHWLNEDELVTILNDLPRRPMLAGDDGLRLSLAGAQDKLPVVVNKDRIGLAMNGTPSTHILKSAIATLDDSVVNEHFCLELAAALKLATARSLIRTAGDHRFLLVERYDRTRGKNGQSDRVHQEDFCQALGRASETKYQHEGGPDLNDCFKLIRAETRPSAPSVLKFLDAIIFNALVGNHDAHAKNFSLLYGMNGTAMAPLYDIVSTAVYPDLTSKMAMKIASQYTFKGVMPRHWEQLASNNGLAAPQVLKRLSALATQMPKLCEKVYSQSNDFDFQKHPVAKRIVELINSRCTMTLRRLSR